MGYLNLVGSFIYKEPLFRTKLAALASNDAQLKTDSWAQNTKCLFFQPTVPSGWTQDVSQNDKAIRVVGPTGGGGSGGSQALSSTITLAHSHTLPTPTAGSHTHAYPNHTHLCGTAVNVRSSNNVFAADGSFFLTLYSESGGSANITELTATLATPGALTLSTQADHNHGAVGSSLTNFVFAYCDVIVGTRNAPGGTYVDLTSQWHTGDIINFDPFASYAANDSYNNGNLMPAGSIMIFGQPAAPTGWTKISSINDRMLRIVSGVGGGSGGTQLVSSGVSLAHTHSLASVADHTHSFPAHTHNLGTAGSVSGALVANGSYAYVQDSIAGGGLMAQCEQTLGLPTSAVTVYKSRSLNTGGGNTDAQGGHTHSIVSQLADFTLSYVDVIQCSKDSTGAPYTYTDYTAEFAWKKLVTYQRLNTLAKNDAYVQYHTTPVGTQTFFFMASPPAGWTKLTAQNDIALRMVSGGSGGSVGGGSHTVSSNIPLAHTHTVVGQLDHTHSISHIHALDTGTQTIVRANTVLVQGSGRVCASNTGAGSSAPGVLMNNTSNPPTEVLAVAGAHDHGGVTDSQLTDVSLAYVDVIWCSKS